ncbi:TATA element modulatory factor [Callorhinchus milii]|uniref:TATA element modulatory factor n=1 Tax=Callorhinchus milii TaxID=7868 RepID=UPI001C3F820A|nr:TATA element modulatory factor [Callorhinchus milii]
MSWFNASHLSSFAKQALSQAQKSIDRVLDIQEDEGDSWAHSITPGYEEALLVKSSSISGGWVSTQWGTPIENSPNPCSEDSLKAITTPVTRTVVDESENFFSAFLLSADIQTLQNTPVVSKPPAKSQLPKEVKGTLTAKPSESIELSVPEKPYSEDESSEALEIDDIELKESNDLIVSQLPSVTSESSESCTSKKEVRNKEDEKLGEATENESDSLASGTLADSTGEKMTDNTEKNEHSESLPDSPSKPSTPPVVLEGKEPKSEDRQSNTPSPPISTFSSGTSTTSDIEVLDHESVLSESSASSRQEAADSKASLHLMQTSFQLLSTSACNDYQRLDEYQKLTESSSSSDAFERIDAFSVQSLDSRSVSEINSDDDMPGRGCNLASGSGGQSASNSEPTEQPVGDVEESTNEMLKEIVFDETETEMEESGRSATPVNSEQPEVLLVPVLTVNENQNTEAEIIDEPPSAIAEVECQTNGQFEKLQLQKIIDELTEKLEKREIQLLAVSKDKAGLEETIDNLKDEMIGLKEETNGISPIKEEFTNRIAESEKKAQVACKERDNVKKELKILRAELATRLNSNETAELMREKDDQINALMEEGEKLSKQQLQNSNNIKKMRAKEKDNESLITKQSKKIKELEEEVQHLQQVLDGKEDIEKQHRENIKKLNAVVERQEKENSNLEINFDELKEKNRSLQSALDSSYKELAELHRANAAKDSEAQEAALSHEMKTKEALSLGLERAQEEARQQQEALAVQVADLRLALQRAEQQQGRKEDYLRQEIGELQQRLQEADNRNQELSQSVTSASKPLLRQIENLQATFVAQSLSWEKLEKNLSDRLADSQTQLASAMEKERSVTEELLLIRTQISSLESQNSLIRQDKSRLQAHLEAERVRLEKTEDESNRHYVEFENLKAEYTKALEDAKREKTLLTNQLEMEKLKAEHERKKATLAQETLKEKERKLFSNQVMEPALNTPTLSRSSSVSGAEMASLQASIHSQEDLFEHSFGSMTTSANGTNLYEALRMGAGSSVFENLQSQLKQREGEIAQLQLEISSLEKTRAIMAEELVKLTTQNDELQEKVNEIPILREQLKDIDQRYNTILQMYGEKAEEAEELRLDLEDVKNMYKAQIDELLKQRPH